MIMRETDKRVLNQKIPKSHLVKWMNDNKFLFKDSQVQYHDLRKTKDRFEWNKFKRSTITFEQIWQIRNRNSLFARYKCDNKDKRIVVPYSKPIFGIKSSVVSAILTKYINENRNSKFLSKKFKELSAEITEKEIKLLNLQRKLKSRECSSIDLGFVKDPTHHFKENTTLFANPNFSTLNRFSPFNKPIHHSVIKMDGPMKFDSIKNRKKRSTITHWNMNDFEDMLLTKRIMKGKRLRSLAVSEVKSISPVGESIINTFRKSFNNTARNSFGLKRRLLNASELRSNSYNNGKLNISTRAGSTHANTLIMNPGIKGENFSKIEIFEK